jgi:hypothetical protein
MRKCVFALLPALCLTMCHKVTGRRHPADETTLTGTNPKDLNMVLVAVKRLQQSFNAGRCDLIYDRATIEFRELESRESWLATCSRLRSDLGEWRQFSVEPGDARAVFAARRRKCAISGTASFSKGAFRLWTTWNLDSGEAKLFSLSLQGKARVPEASQPEFLKRRFIDPPPSRPERGTRSARGLTTASGCANAPPAFAWVQYSSRAV